MADNNNSSTEQTTPASKSPDNNTTVENTNTNDQEETNEQEQPVIEEIRQAPPSSFEGISPVSPNAAAATPLTSNAQSSPPPPPPPPSISNSDQLQQSETPVALEAAGTTTPAPSKKPKKSEPAQILGYGPTFPDKLFERLQLKVEMPASVRLRFQLTKSVIISFIPDGSQAIGVLEAGDWIRSIDGTSIENRRKVYTLLRQKTKPEAYTIVFNVKRPLRNVFLTNEKQFNEYLPPAIEMLPGYSYLLAFLATFPGAKVGLHVKSYENRVYVSSISHGSISEAVFHVGDVILSVDDVAIASVSDAHKRIHDALKNKKWVQTVIERAESKVALQRMNVALKADRKLDINPKMAEDILGIVTKEIKRMKECKEEKIKGILHRGNRPSCVLTVSQISRETPIQCDPVNVKLLIKVPKNRPTMMQRRRLGKPRGFGAAGNGFFKQMKTQNGISYTEFVPSSSSTSSSSTTTRSTTSSYASESDKK